MMKDVYICSRAAASYPMHVPLTTENPRLYACYCIKQAPHSLKLTATFFPFRKDEMTRTSNRESRIEIAPRTHTSSPLPSLIQ